VLRVHPSYLMDDEDRTLIDIWAAYRRDGMGGVGHLPFAGGYAQQPSALMRALEAMDGADGRIRARLK
jgi:hypothetical protein